MGVVPTPTDQTIKRKSLVDQEIKSSFKAGSSDQEPILAIKNFDRRRRWKYRAHYGDYPLYKQVLIGHNGRYVSPGQGWSTRFCYALVIDRVKGFP